MIKRAMDGMSGAEEKDSHISRSKEHAEDIARALLNSIEQLDRE